MGNPGEKVITSNDFEMRLRMLEAKMNGLLSLLVFDNTLGEIKNFIIQFDVTQFSGAGTAVTFLKPFKVGTVPVVVGVSKSVNCALSITTGPSTTGFTGQSKFHDGTSLASFCMWFAIGERG